MCNEIRLNVLITFLLFGQFSTTFSSYVFQPIMSQEVPSSPELKLRGSSIKIEDSLNDWVSFVWVYRRPQQIHPKVECLRGGYKRTFFDALTLDCGSAAL